MRTCPRCGYKDPAMQVPDTRKRDRSAYMRKRRAAERLRAHPKKGKSTNGLEDHK